ncbi:MAG: GNAT family N-acetyltransferase [Propionibacteriaceae bacterium]|nr:GNAT family N-acetyltransferase [Propionibacteriaceae bacterium]
MAYEFRLHKITAADVEDPTRWRDFARASWRGFNSEPPGDDWLAHQITLDLEQGSVQRTAHAPALPGGEPTEVPVATWEEWVGSLNIGGSLVDVLQISAVTVAAPHRRQGILRRFMGDSLIDAATAGVPIAALTASDTRIYGRFGFGLAVREESIEVLASPREAVRGTDPGQVGYLPLENLQEVAFRVFQRCHATTPGSIGRSRLISDVHCRSLNEDRKANKKILTIAHWDADGVIDGYATWKMKDDTIVEVLDFAAITEEASLALWRMLTGLELIVKVAYANARVDEVLPLALPDSRRYKVLGRSDMLWLRILDPAACLTARDYFTDGCVTIGIDDAMGYAAGTFELAVTGGRAEVRPVLDEPEVNLDVAALSAALLGGTRLASLAAIGDVTGSADAIARLDALLARPRAPYCNTHF